MNYSSVNYITYFDYASLIIMIVLLASYYMMKHLDSIQNKILKLMFFSHIFVVLIDIMNVWSVNFFGNNIYGLLYTTHMLYFVVHTLTVFGFCLYCCCLLDRFHLKNKFAVFLICLPMIVLCIASFTNHWTNLLFSINEDLMYVRGPGIFIAYAAAVIYVVLSIVMITVYRKKITRLQLVVTYCYIVLCMTGVLLQWLFPKLLVESFGMTIALLMLFFTTAKFADLYDEDYNILNRRAFFTLIDREINWIEDSYYIFLKVHDFQIFRVTMGKEFQEKLILQIITFLNREFMQYEIFHYSNSQFVLRVSKGDEYEAQNVINIIVKRFSDVWNVGDSQIRCRYHVGKCLCGKDAEVQAAERLKDVLDYVNDYSKTIDKHVLTIEDIKMGTVARNVLIQRMLQTAVDNDGFEVFYQPIYSVKEKKVISAEALIRLKDTEHGYVSPEEFIPIAEKNGLIMKIGEFVFRSVCSFIKQNQLEQYGIQFVEVNLSVVQCMQEKLYRQLLNIMKEYDVSPDRINLEITETAEATRMGAFQNNFLALKDSGINFSLDDYGTGYSNIGFLYKFPFKIIKIDKSLLWGAFENEKAMITLTSSIELAKRLDLQVVVEGVEKKEHIEKLEELGCEYLQGYYFSKPIPGHEFIKYVKES